MQVRLPSEAFRIGQKKNLFSTSSVFMLAMIDFHILWQMLLLSLSAPIWIRVRHHITTTKTKLSSHILIKLNYIVRFNLQYCGLIIKTINQYSGGDVILRTKELNRLELFFLVFFFLSPYLKKDQKDSIVSRYQQMEFGVIISKAM